MFEQDEEPFETEIESAITCLQYQISKLVENVSPALMRLQHLLTLWGRRQNGELDILAMAGLIDRVRTEVMEAEKAISDEALEVQDKCTNIAAKISSNLDYSNGQLAGMAQTISGLQREVVNLREQIARRHQEHAISSPEVRSRVMEMTGGKCAYCDQDVSDIPGDGKATMHVDHIIPKSVGGPDHICNYVPACERCNISKSAGHVLEFIQRRMTSVRVQLLDAAE